MKTIEIMAGTHIEKAAEILCNFAPARATFNGIEIRARYATTRAADLVATWTRRNDARCVAWSPAREAQKRADAEDVRAKQVHIRNMVAGLPAIDWTDHAGPIAWLCTMQNAADRVGVVYDRGAVILAFALAGYERNVYCGDTFDGNDRNIFARWLIGQALEGIAAHGAPHGMIHRFADDWRAKFGASPK